MQGMCSIDNCVRLAWANFGQCWLKLQIAKPLWLFVTPQCLWSCTASRRVSKSPLTGCQMYAVHHPLFLHDG
ncbi:hypothetical protein BYT27DRAFT_7200363 [Phlegmacium glaucopus]|nr:hypothetical protein BYT27DRAFT_7200363 [Phlegmacium glaucopus]